MNLRLISCWRTARDISSGFILSKLFVLQSNPGKMCDILLFHAYFDDILLLDADIELYVNSRF